MTHLLWWPEAVLAAVTAVYLAGIGFRLLMICVGSTTATPRLAGVPATPDRARDARLPSYTVLAALTGTEATAAENARLIADLSALDYPAGRLEVLLLADDRSELPPGALADQFTVVNVGAASLSEAYAKGLARASGELCVSYRPGQTPDAQQLRAAAEAFRGLPAWVVCLRSGSSTPNADVNWLTRCAAAEKAVNSVLLQRGLHRFKMVLPGGWGSAHFRTEALRQLGAWKAGDSSTDADLAVKIARRGWSVSLLDSVTAEQADSQLGRWMRERTESLRDGNRAWLAADRAPLRLWRDLGPGRFIGFQLTSALTSFTSFANPLFWLLAVAWLVSGTGPVAGVFPAPELYLVVAAMLLGNVLVAYSLMIGCMDQGMLPAVRTMFLAPVYWALSSVAAYRALLPARRPEQPLAAAPVPSIAASRAS
jgi:cellulose synthase/poly-beta-1,6-N-acetylglucosamine synthase-like glycosyltransferase